MNALIVVDYQNDFVNGTLGFPEARLLEPIIGRKLDKYHNGKGRVIFTLDTHGDDYSETAEGRSFPTVHCIEGSEGHRLYGRIAEKALPEDIKIFKHSYGSLELAKVLREYNFDEVELCGLVTDICVIANAVIAKTALPESRISVDGRACAGSSKSAHENALQVMRGLQIEVI